jgi:potassium-transporting ATPase KdpC subunit
MKTLLKQSILLTVCTVTLFVFVYPALLWGLAQVAAPNQGKGEIIEKDGKIIGFAQVGQSFTTDKYFNSRPSAVGYNAAGSGGSNKGPSNPEYLAALEARIDTFLAHNPAISRKQVPAELITASGSGLDPHISPEAAYVQIPRIARERNISEAALGQLVDSHVEAPLLGLFGTSKINVLALNIALDQLK